LTIFTTIAVKKAKFIDIFKVPFYEFFNKQSGWSFPRVGEGKEFLNKDISPELFITNLSQFDRVFKV